MNYNESQRAQTLPGNRKDYWHVNYLSIPFIDIEQKPFKPFMSLKTRSRSPGSKLVFALPWCFCIPYFVRLCQIFLQILGINHFNWPTWPWKQSKGHEVRIWSSHCNVYQIWWDFIKYLFKYWAKNILNDLHDLENKVEVIWFKLGLCLALVLLYTKLS